MSGKNWTPGPWALTVRHDYREILGPRKSASWFGKSGVWAVAYIDTDLPEDLQDANAHLIAAAPALYDALEEAFDFLGGVDGASEIRAKIMATLALARGEVQ